VPLDGLLPDGESCRLGEPVAAAPEPAVSRLASDETRAQVRACIDRLPESYRTVLVLRDLEELDTDQTARALGTTRAVVKTRLHRARQALRTLLEPLVGV
jgi:RNA polymerase sigma-70 factor, ECF subfamily